MEVLGGIDHVESHFCPFRDSVVVGARSVHGLRQMYHSLGYSFGHTRRICQVTWVMWNLILLRLGTALMSVHDGCTVCTERTIGSEIILDALNGTPR